MLALLIVSCVLIYGLVMFFLPRNYHAELQSQVTADFYELVEIIEQNGWESSTNSILEFALKNNASVTVTDGAGESVFSVNSVNLASTENVVPATDSTPSMSCSSTFQDNGQSYQLYANIALIAVSQSYGILLQLLPLIVGIILVVSVLGAMILFPVLFQAAGQHQQCGKADDHLGYDLEVRSQPKRRDRGAGCQLKRDVPAFERYDGQLEGGKLAVEERY